MNSHSSLAYTRVVTPLGPMILTASPEALVAAHFADQALVPAAFRTAIVAGQHPILAEAAAALARYFAGDALALAPPAAPRLAPSGTPFQCRTWEALRAIPLAATKTYRDIAIAVAMPRAARAIGAAIGRNPLAIFIPCHRVIGSGGALTGYAGGLGRKRALLDLEQHALRIGSRYAA
ncbi:MAG: methylated-DNA--[protein]-cysteine S-methyltransferase [Casimicrobiaceae bacterium]